MLGYRGEKCDKTILVLANYDVGLYQFRRELLEALLQKGYHVTIALPKGDLVQPLIDHGCQFINIPVDRRGINPKTDSILFLNYLKLLRSCNPDLVITYTIKPNVYGGIACRMMKIPYAVNITGLGTSFQKRGFLRALVTGLYKTALKRASVVFFENISNMETLLKRGICKKMQCKLLNGAGVNTEHFYNSAYPFDTTTRFLFIGRVMKEKGVDELLEAMQRLQNDGENCVLDMLGQFEENYGEKIKQYTQAGWLHYYGYQKDVRPYIDRAHCFVLPSWHEGMANTNLECASMGRPIITSRIHGCMEAVIENESGFLCESKNSDDLYRKMKQFCAMSYEERLIMGRSGRLHMEAVFDKKAVVADTIGALPL